MTHFVRHNRFPLALFVIGVLALFADVDAPLRLMVAGLCIGAGIGIISRRYGLSWSGFIGGFGRDR